MNEAVRKIIAELRAFRAFESDLVQVKKATTQDVVEEVLRTMKEPTWEVKAITSVHGSIQDELLKLEQQMTATLDIDSLIEAADRFNQQRISELTNSIPSGDDLHQVLLDLTTEALYPKSVGKVNELTFIDLFFTEPLAKSEQNFPKIFQLQLKDGSVYFDYEALLCPDSLRQTLIFSPVTEMEKHFRVPLERFTLDEPFEISVEWNEHDNEKNIEIAIHAFFAPIA